MADAVDLKGAASQCSVDITTRFYLNTLAADMLAYWKQISNTGLFVNQAPSDHPIINWLAIIAAITQVGFSTQNNILQVQNAINATFRMNWIAQGLDDAGFINTAQAAALLLSYNQHIAIPACFAAGTSVWTPDGARPIETISLGDIVYSWDGKEVTRRAVTKLHRDVVLFTRIISAGGDTIVTTDNHPFRDVGGSVEAWTPIGDIPLGTYLKTESGRCALVASQKSESKRTMVYNIGVEGDECYFVGTSRLLVHNK